jgi:hypothetical protein
LSSDLACVGLAANSKEEFDALIAEVGPRSTQLGARNGVSIARWQDSSGSRLTFRIRNGSAVAFVPSIAGTPGVRFGPLTRLTDDVWSAAAVDENGEQWTSMAVDLEEGGVVSEGYRSTTAATLVALGRSVTVHRDEAAFSYADDSLLDPSGERSEPPPHFVERGWSWPQRMAPESFISDGVFATSGEAEATARLYGIVLRADGRVNQLTGQAFVVARVRCLGMEVDVCLAGADHTVPEAGSVLGGTVYLVASLGPAVFDGSDQMSVRSRIRRLVHR